MKRVVVTGMGIVSPVGVGVNTAWDNIINSKSGLGKTSGFDASSLPSHVSGEVPLGSYEEGKWNPEEWVDAKELRRIDKFIAYAISASRQAMQDANFGELTEAEKEEFGVHLGSGIGGLQTIYENSVLLGNDQYRKMSPFFIPAALINLPSGHVSIEYDLKGPNLSIVTACATGTHAIGDSYKMIRDGEALMMIAGGAEASVNPIGVAGFARMNALSTQYNDNPQAASRPWDKGRDGFVIAEGSGVLVLEEYEHAKARGAKIYAEIVGYGSSGDANHITAPCADGNGAARCMERALRFGGIKKEDIGYINAHGTSTPLGDKAEIQGIKKVFGEHAYNLSVSSTKSATGHLLGASGAIEAIFSIKALQTEILPPTLNLENRDEEVDPKIDLVPLVSKKKDIQYAMSNSFGFGGTNGTLIFKKYSE